ncbi:MAG: hypothetical protein KBS61_02170 [Chryseobacterium sp.]|nr:hypothetical protein [Candidatus Chryseobacterium enterohippi]
MSIYSINFKEKYIQISMVIITIVMTIFRFLMNEKGRVNPDSIIYMRFAHVFPTIDSTVAPPGYPMMIKFFTLFGLDEFWGSKALGICAVLFIILFAYWKKFYLKEVILICSLFSYVSIFSFTMSEALSIPFVFLLLYLAHLAITEKLSSTKAFIYLALNLIILYNIRYSSLFIIGATGLFGLLFWNKKFGKTFIIAGSIGMAYVGLFKLFYLDYFNENYIKDSLITGLHTTPELLTEFFQGIATAFNPFIHMANPNGGIVNFAIYGLGLLNILLMVFLFIKNKLSDTQLFYLNIGICGIICSYFIQYFYPINPLDYRLLSPFLLSIWMVYFQILLKYFGNKTFVIGALSLCSGFVFTWLSKGNYLENRKIITEYLQKEKLDKIPLQFFVVEEEDLEKIQVAEILSTVNPQITLTYKASDTLRPTTLTRYKVLQKIKIDKNKYQ